MTPIKLAAAMVGAVMVTFATAVAGQTVTGKATYYNPAGGTGACGTTIQDTDLEAALGYMLSILASLL